MAKTTKMLSTNEFAKLLENPLGIDEDVVKQHIEFDEEYALIFADIWNSETSTFNSTSHNCAEEIYDILGKKRYVNALNNLAKNGTNYDERFLITIGKYAIFEILTKIKTIYWLTGCDIMKGACIGNQVEVVRFLKIRMKSEFFTLNPLCKACEEGSLVIFNYLHSFGNVFSSTEMKFSIFYTVRWCQYTSERISILSALCKNKQYANKKSIQRAAGVINFNSKNIVQVLQCFMNTGLLDINKKDYRADRLNYDYDVTIVKIPIWIKVIDKCSTESLEFFIKQKNIDINIELTVHCSDFENRYRIYKISPLEFAIVIHNGIEVLIA